jgi:hypothetical protein
MNRFEQRESTERKPDYSSELLAMVQADQDMRKHGEETGEWDNALDKKHTSRLKEILEKIGWPTVSKVGNEAATAAWLLVQHADHDPEFQQECLKLMKVAMDGEVNKQDIAFLEDRVRAAMDRPTLYGTQFYQNEKGQFGPMPIEDRERLNERRAQVGLGPFEEYEQEMQELNQKLEGQKGGSGTDKS